MPVLLQKPATLLFGFGKGVGSWWSDITAQAAPGAPATRASNSMTTQSLAGVEHVDSKVAEATFALGGAKPSLLPKPEDLGLTPGLSVKYYYIGESMKHMPEIRNRIANFEATVKKLHFDNEEDFKKLDRNLPNRWAAGINGVIAVEAAGKHDFFMSSHDGSKLWIDGRMIIDIGGVGSADEQKQGSITLDVGYHAIKLQYFENIGDASLNVEWQGPTTKGQKSYVKGYNFKDANTEMEKSLPSPKDVGLSEGFLMSVYTTNLPDPMDTVPDLDSLTPDFTRRSAIMNFPNHDAFKKVCAEIPKNKFAAEWQGVIPVHTSGEYKFYLSSGDGSHLWIDEGLLIDNDGLHGADGIKEGTIQLTHGYHTVKIDFFESNASASINAQWSGPGFVGKDVITGYHFSKACGPVFDGIKCTEAVPYCNEISSTCGATNDFKNAQDSKTFDFEALPSTVSLAGPPSHTSLSVEECCATVCKGEGSEAPADAPAEAPAPPPPPPPVEANLCTMQADGSCKSMLNMYCGQWRDSADTMSSSKQKKNLEMCMAQDCQQSMESGRDTPGCRFLDSNGFCFAYNSAQAWCGGAGTGSPFCTDGGKGWAQPPLGNADSSQTGWVPSTFPYRGGSTDKGSLECMCMKDCTCSEQKCFCVDNKQAPVGPVRIQSS